MYYYFRWCSYKLVCSSGIFHEESTFAGSPKVLELFRSNRALKAGRLHWAVPGSAPHSARRVFSDSPLTVQMVRLAPVTF